MNSDRLEKIMLVVDIILCVAEAVLYGIEAYINYQQCPKCY